jgi:glycogen synthase
LLELDIQILILAKSEKQFQEKISNLHQRFSNKFLVLADSEDNKRDIYAISDSVLFL